MSASIRTGRQSVAQIKTAKKQEEADPDEHLVADLFDSISEGNSKNVARILLEAKKPENLLKRKDPQGLRPLKKAITLNKAEIARMLVANGASPSLRDPLGKTPLHIAVMQGRRELIAPLLVSVDSSVNVQDKHGWTPLHYAIRGKHLKALEWLLYAGADVNVKNKEDESPLDHGEDDALISKMLKAHSLDREIYPVILSSAFISRKNLNYIGTDGLLMFVTSQSWSPHEQFFFCKRIRPTEARPLIPLRWNEYFYSDVYHYRTMRKLKEGKTRVKLYILFFEALKHDEIVLKITSKDKFLGEVPMIRSTYIQDKYTNFMGSCEIDIKPEGQFVMVKRNVALALRKTPEGALSCRKYSNFLCDLPQGSLPAPAKDWNATRQNRAVKENEQLVESTQKLLESLSEVDFLTEYIEMTKLQEPKPEETPAEVETEALMPITSQASVASMAEKVSDAGSRKATDSEEGLVREEEEAPLEPMLEAYHEDDCDDFYYISKGWGLYLTVMQSFPLSVLTDAANKEKLQIRCSTDFFFLSHTSEQQPKNECIIQIPKTEEFVKVGTVLVFIRTSVAPGEENPDPDDSAQEHLLSNDMKNTWGVSWQNQERDRWSLIGGGIVNKRARVIFKTKIFSAFVVVQLYSGEEKSEREADDSDSSEEEGESDTPGDGEDGEGDEPKASQEGGDEPLQPVTSSTAPAKKKSKKLKPTRYSISSILASMNDELCQLEEPDEEDEQIFQAEEGEGEGEEAAEDMTVTAEGGDSTEVPGDAAAAAPVTDDAEEPGAPAPSPMVAPKEEEENKDENASNLGRSVADDDRNNNNIISKATAAMNKNNNEIRDNDEDFDQTSLAPEERTIVVGLPPIATSFVKLDVTPSVYRPMFKSIQESETELSETVEQTSSEKNKSQTESDPIPKIAGGPMYTGMPEEFPPMDGASLKDEDESDEELPGIPTRKLSITVVKNGVKKSQDFTYGPKLASLPLVGVDLDQVKTEIAQMWRYRNHVKTCILIFSRPRGDHEFDMIIDIVQSDDIYVRAESHYSVGYSLVGESQPLPIKCGRLLSFTIEGPISVEKCEGGISNQANLKVRTLYFSHSQINSLEYVVKRPQVEEVKGPASKKGKKKEEVKVELEPDARLEAMAFNAGSGTNGVDLVALPIWLTGPDLWKERHINLRASDDKLLNMLIECLSKSRALARNWWRLLILLGYTEKDVEGEKGRTQNSVVVRNYLKRWFEDCLTRNDRGILRLIQALDTLHLDIAIDNVVKIIKLYKSYLLEETDRPRYLKLLFHWVLQTKITRRNLLNLPDPQILRPVSDQFLLNLSDFLPAQHLFKIGAAMDVEDNVLHAIAQEEIITAEAYLCFRVLIKSRQKKDEIIHYTLLLMEMFKQVELPAADEFMVRETKKWMETVAETEPEVCSKLENVFG